MVSSVSSSGLSLDQINNIGATVVNAQEQTIRAALANATDLSSGEMLKLQTQIQQWTIFVNLQSTLTKDVADALRAVIQKSS
jgi:type III secretion protein F